MSYPPHQQQIHDFLTALSIAEPDRIINDLAHYHQLLLEYNPQINLVSRKTAPDDYWRYHFLDSMLALKCLDFNAKVVLDFGSGGGLPGIPIGIASPQARVFLLEATRKKCLILRQMLDALHLKDCRVVNQRLEDYALMAEGHRFDYIVCRAVALEMRYLQPLRQLLRKNGRVILYKAHRMDDLTSIRHQILLEQDVPDLGFRRLVAIDRNDLIDGRST